METSDAVSVVIDKLECLGMRTVVHYLCENLDEYRGETAIIVACLPDRAFVVCVEIYHSYSRYKVTLNICGQLNGDGSASELLKTKKHSCVYESESPNGIFTRQIHLNNAAASLEERIEACILFCAQFMEVNCRLLTRSFSMIPLLPLAPVRTKEYDLAARAPSRTAAQEHFEGKVLPLLPQKILPPRASRRCETAQDLLGKNA